MHAHVLVSVLHHLNRTCKTERLEHIFSNLSRTEDIALNVFFPTRAYTHKTLQDNTR